jgi:hypothetical protein
VAKPGEESSAILTRQLKNTTSAEEVPDARRILTPCCDLRSEMASPGEDTQQCDLEQDEREDLSKGA